MLPTCDKPDLLPLSLRLLLNLICQRRSAELSLQRCIEARTLVVRLAGAPPPGIAAAVPVALQQPFLRLVEAVIALLSDLQADEKSKLTLGPDTHYRGYQQLGANVTRFEGGFQRDWHEAIDLYKEEDFGQLQVGPGVKPVPSSCLHPFLSKRLQTSSSLDLDLHALWSACTLVCVTRLST